MTLTRIRTCKTWFSKSSPRKTWKCTLLSVIILEKATVVRNTRRIVRAKIHPSILCEQQETPHSFPWTYLRPTSQCPLPQHLTQAPRQQQQLPLQELAHWQLNNLRHNWWRRTHYQMVHQMAIRVAAVQQLTRRREIQVSLPRLVEVWSREEVTSSSMNFFNEKGGTR